MSTKQPISVLVYDGHCAFCRAQMERIRRYDKDGQFEYVRNDNLDVLQRFPQLRDSNLQNGLRLITPDGQVHVGADAVYEVGRQLPYWGRLAWMYRMPGCRHIARWMYGLIAANRYMMAGRCQDDVCAKPQDGIDATQSRNQRRSAARSARRTRPAIPRPLKRQRKTAS